MSAVRVRQRPVEALVTLMVLAVSLRLLGAIIGGFIAMSLHHDVFAPASQRAGTILETFGRAGDTAGAVLAVAAAALVGWGRVRDTGLMFVVRVVLVVTAALVCLRVAGYFMISAEFNAAGSVEESVVTGAGVCDLLLCVGALWALGRSSADPIADGSDDADPLVFAVDRGTAEVFAFFSYAEAARTLSVYSIEDGEFAFYTDEGYVIDASVVDERPRFTVTDDNRRDLLASALRSFAARHDLDVDVQDDDLTAYAVPISDWQWLELWPRWMRGLGRLVNRLRR